MADGCAGLHGVGGEPIVDEVDHRHVRSTREGGVDGSPVAQLPVIDQVVGDIVVDECRGIVRVADRHDRAKHLIVDVDGLGRVLRLLVGLGDDDGHAVAHVTRLALRQERVRAHLHGRAVLGLHHPAADQVAQTVGLDVVAGEHGQDTRHAFRRGLVDPADAGMGIGRADEAGVRLPVLGDVVRVAAAAGDEALVLLADDARTDALLNHGAPSLLGRLLEGRRAAGSGHDRLDDVVVAGAAAEIALEPLAHLALARVQLCFSRSTALMIMPGVQKPHCSP